MDAFREVADLQRRTWRPRFRLASLFWLAVVIAAFFIGRQSEEIKSLAGRWWQVTRVRWGADVNERYSVVSWPPGGVTINEQSSISSVTVSDRSLVDVSLIGSRQIRISPRTEGDGSISYQTLTGTYRNRKFRFTVESGQVVDWLKSSQ